MYYMSAHDLATRFATLLLAKASDKIALEWATITPGHVGETSTSPIEGTSMVEDLETFMK
jgi:hypothetical protein